MRAWALALLIVLAGCTAPEPTDDAGAPTPSPAPEARSLFWSRCAELDYYYPVDASDYAASGLKPKTTDTAGRVANELINAISCKEVRTANGSEPNALAWFTMVSVEPHPTLRLANVSAYVWIESLLGPTPMINSFFAPTLQATNATMTLDFQDAGGKTKSSATLRVRPGAASDIRASSSMVGDPRAGKAGSMAAYTGSTKSGLELYRIDFSEYRSYATGTALISHGLGGPVAQAAGSPVPAYHNFDYDVRFVHVGTTSAT